MSRELNQLSSWLAPLIASSSDTKSTYPDLSTQQSDQDRTGLDPRSAIFRRLVAGIIYSRGLALTYYVVVAAILVAFVGAYWGPILKFWFKRKFARRGASSHSVTNDRTGEDDSKEHNKAYEARVGGYPDDETVDSGGSSPSLVTERTDEHTPLLNNKAGSVERRSFVTAVSNRLSSWLTYQPKPLPGFRSRVMPSNGTTVFMLAYLAVNVFYLFFKIEFSVNMLFIFADRAAVLFVTNLPVLYVLSAKNQPLQALTGYSYASLNIAHRRLGEYMCLLAAIHVVGMFMVWVTLLRPGGYEFVRFITDRVVILGLGAFICYETLFLTSLATVRRMTYELFLATHIFLQIGSLAFLYFHHPKSRIYVLLSFGIWAVDRIVYRFIIKTIPLKAALTVLPDGETTGVSVSIPVRKPSRVRAILGLENTRDGWQNLDHIFLSIPELGQAHALQSHPFSIASAAPSRDAQGADLELIIRARDGFSKDLLAYASEHDTVNVRIDGPYGAHSASRLLQHSDARIIIAGGSGIAVTQPLLTQLLADERDQSVDIEHVSPDKAVRPVIFVWVVHSQEQLSWIDLPRLRAITSKAGIDVIIPEPTSRAGRPNLAEMMTQWVKSKPNARKFGVVVSGPDAMSREVRNGCAALQSSGVHVDIEVEKYGW